MLFNSLPFAIFLPIVFILYWCLPHKYRWILLFVASYYFYMNWNAKYAVLILFTTCISYGSARLLEKQDNKKKKKTALLTEALIPTNNIYINKNIFTIRYLFISYTLNLFKIPNNIELSKDICIPDIANKWLMPLFL